MPESAASRPAARARPANIADVDDLRETADGFLQTPGSRRNRNAVVRPSVPQRSRKRRKDGIGLTKSLPGPLFDSVDACSV